MNIEYRISLEILHNLQQFKTKIIKALPTSRVILSKLTMGTVCLLTDSSTQSLESNSRIDTYSTLANTGIGFNAFTERHELRKNNPFKIIIGRIKINSIQMNLT